MGETSKRFDARMKDGFFTKYIQNSGIDIGCGEEPVSFEVQKWDIIYGNSDATFMEGVPDCHFDFAYSYHLLEHLDDPVTALRNWYRIIKHGGWLIVGVPHRDLYEKKTILPSRYNADHKSFYLPAYSEPPHTRSLVHTFQDALGNYRLISLQVYDAGNTNFHAPLEHALGEYTIEIIIQKPHLTKPATQV
jgi:SAM-dependent methyltransferase